jgi:hypothetical protein
MPRVVGGKSSLRLGQKLDDLQARLNRKCKMSAYYREAEVSRHSSQAISDLIAQLYMAVEWADFAREPR